MENSVAILCVGSELLDGRVVDTNSNFIANRLEELGIPLRHVLACDDREEDILHALRFLLEGSNFIIISGGLGPTTDDLTREGVAHFLHRELVLDPKVMELLKDLYQKRQRPFDPSNNKQALFPKGSRILPNPIGTAPGFLVHQDPPQQLSIVALPGVPKELRAMFEEAVVPILREHREEKSTVRGRRVLRVFGVAESRLNTLITECKLTPAVHVIYQASFPEVTIILKATGKDVDLDAPLRRVRQAIGEEFIFSEDLALPLDMVVHQLLLEKKSTVAVAESCTGGLLATYLTNTSGSSTFFAGGVGAYSNEVKEKVLRVSPRLIEKFGAVSAEVAIEMASGIRSLLGSDIALSVTGIAGPGGGNSEKPVGLFYIGLAAATNCEAYRFFISSTRENIRKFATFAALDLIRRHLLGLPLRGNN